MNRQMIITTTNTIEGAKIEQYIQLITINSVIGTNFFSDFGASFTDFFGGFSGTYQDKLEKVYERGISELRRKALNVGANAILGIKIDFDEISGKGKSMFMFSISGTAVKINYENKENENKSYGSLGVIPSSILDKEVDKIIIIKKLEKGRLLNENDWQLVTSNPIKETLKPLLGLYLKHKSKKGVVVDNQEVVMLLENFPNYITLFYNSEAEGLLYSQIERRPNQIVSLLKFGKLFNANKTLELFKMGQLGIGLNCLDIQKERYDVQDLKVMRQILNFLDNLEDKGRIEKVKGLLTKEKEMYICPNGHKNELEIKHCLHRGVNLCDLNIKGLTKKEMNKISLFRIKVEALGELLESEVTI